MLTQLKFYLLGAALLGAIVGTWMVRGWYEDGKVVTALKIQKDAFEEQQEIDTTALVKSLAEQEGLRNAYEELKFESTKIDLCANNGIDFLRLFNRGAVAANAKK